MDRWEEKPHEVVCQVMTDVPSYKVKDQWGNSHILHCNWLLLVTSEVAIPLHVGVFQVQDKCTRPTPVKPTPEGSDSKTILQEDNGVVITPGYRARLTIVIAEPRICSAAMW